MINVQVKYEQMGSILQESEILCGSDLWNDSMDNTESSDSD
jgi:hypothetical protein